MSLTLPKPILALVPMVASLFLVAGLPTPASAYGHPPVHKAKVKDHKVKVKICGGKAKIKEKACGKRKVKVKGRNGRCAAAIAKEMRYGAAPRHSGRPAPRQRYYGK